MPAPDQMSDTSVPQLDDGPAAGQHRPAERSTKAPSAKPKSSDKRAFRKLVAKVRQRAEQLHDIDDDELAATAATLRTQLHDGVELDELLVEMFARVCEAARRTLGLTPYDVQIYAAVVLHHGAVAEMRTGEGKTLTATMPIALNALAGPVDVATANPYLATRDARTLAPLYNALGLNVNVALAGQPKARKQQVYRHDIVYSTTNELGFDYLRDRLAPTPAQQVRAGRTPDFALIDEADQVLIDEARTPMVISGRGAPPSDLLAKVAAVVAELTPGTSDIGDDGQIVETGDVAIDRAQGTAHLTEAGFRTIEAAFDVEELYAEPELAFRVSAAVEAHHLMESDREYIVVDAGTQADGDAKLEPGVHIVDEATGRVMAGRRFGKGLHEALEAKHGLPIQDEVQTRATLTVQHFYRRYDKLSGMSGTAESAAEEFASTYRIPTYVIDTNRPLIRNDRDDVVFLTLDAKLASICDEIAARRQAGQPVLVGSASVSTSRRVSEALHAAGIEHRTINARNPQQEAATIARAGEPGAVTVATNMAGRGTDILLGGDPDIIVAETVAAAVADQSADGSAELDGDELEQLRSQLRADVEPQVRAQVARDRKAVVASGGLLVLGTERHSSRRIDDQLRGRAGRQGEPGESLFCLSLEDELLTLFADLPLDWAATMLASRQETGADAPVEHPLMGKAVQSAQRRIEEQHAQVRAETLAFDEIVAEQRTVVYEMRDRLLHAPSGTLDAWARRRAYRTVSDAALNYVVRGGVESGNRQHLIGDLATLIDLDTPVDASVADRHVGTLREALTHVDEPDEVDVVVGQAVEAAFDARAALIDDAAMWAQVVRTAALQTLDRHWVDLLVDLERVKDAIGWRQLGQRDPKVEFAREASVRFTEFERQLSRNQTATWLTARLSVASKPAVEDQATQPDGETSDPQA